MYATVKRLTEIYHRSEQSIWRWAKAYPKKRIIYENREYIPEKDKARCWRFRIVVL